MKPARAKFKIWGQHGIPGLAGVNLGRRSNSGLKNVIKNLEFYYENKFSPVVAIANYLNSDVLWLKMFHTLKYLSFMEITFLSFILIFKAF